ncbi:CoA pyrophosphatase [Balneolaceae bacterium YR4-1]|uniref:CoA pyrophosphatase n=1 Tax=Halalkalibaculum roseum TaxID=2709311 RepID=A0A6M1SWU6_9BACT|nr:CoA pyrophosphatase [Halalkalibaculum roseum]NGP77432.1 CoA pyrophosphatase [Halalkalibaculum roseum]
MQPFIEHLSKRLEKPLPGLNAQLRMAPTPLSDGPNRELEPPPNAKKSSVLILLFPNEDERLELILTLRSRDIDHGGQISLPGGRSDENESYVETALREANEEVGINPESVEILGVLSDLYVSHSNNLVKPVVGYMGSIPELTPNPAEVEEAFTVEVKSLAAKKNLTVENWDLKKYSYEVPYWDIHEVPLWGATAMILNELLDLYREYTGEE